MSHRGRKSTDSILIANLSAGATRAQAATAAGVSERTVFRRCQDATFVEQITAARAAFITDATARLSAAATKAVTTLYQLLDAESDSVKLSAARSVLELGLKLRESEEFAARLDAIEARQAQADAHQGGIRRVA